jgi:hypothetical protein
LRVAIVLLSSIHTTTLTDIHTAIRRLPSHERTELRRWVLAHGYEAIDAETDSVELESELLKVGEEPFAGYSKEEIRTVCERVAREVRRP